MAHLKDNRRQTLVAVGQTGGHLPTPSRHRLNLQKIIKNSQKMIKIHGTPILFWERSIFAAEKAFAPPQKHLDLNTHQESNLAPLGSQAGGLTTRPDLYGLGDGTNLANLGKIIEIREMVK